MKLNTKMDFGKRLAQIRKAKGFSQRELAKKIDVTVRVISYYENESDFPPSHFLPRLASALKVSVDKILGTDSIEIEPVNTRIWKRFKRFEGLTRDKQQIILKTIDNFSNDSVHSS